MKFVYPALLAREPDGVTVTFRDLPEAITCGKDFREALGEAADCLDEAIATRINHDMDIPPPSAPRQGEVPISVPALRAAKAALYLAVRDAGITNVALARALGCTEGTVRRLLDPRHNSRMDAIEEALAVLGQGLVIGTKVVA